jgi:hypothetical protein
MKFPVHSPTQTGMKPFWYWDRHGSQCQYATNCNGSRLKTVELAINAVLGSQ